MATVVTTPYSRNEGFARGAKALGDAFRQSQLRARFEAASAELGALREDVAQTLDPIERSKKIAAFESMLDRKSQDLGLNWMETAQLKERFHRDLRIADVQREVKSNPNITARQIANTYGDPELIVSASNAEQSLDLQRQGLDLQRQQLAASERQAQLNAQLEAILKSPEYIGQVESAKITAQEKAKKPGEARKALTAIRKMASDFSNLDRMIARAEELVDMDSFNTNTAGFLSDRYSWINSESHARELENLLEGIKSHVALDSLTTLRQSSPTGAGLGVISDRDVNLLKDIMGRLDQTAKPIVTKKLLNETRNIFSKLQNDAVAAFRAEYGDPEQFGGPSISPPPSPSPSPAPAPQQGREGEIMEDATGNRVIFRNGQWQELD